MARALPFPPHSDPAGQALETALATYGVRGAVRSAASGPVLTTYEFEPLPGQRLARIRALGPELAMALGARSVTVEAPIPGTSLVGFQVARPDRETIPLAAILRSGRPAEPLAVGLGATTAGVPRFLDLAQAPHVLIAGTTGSGKSVMLNSVVCSLLTRDPRDVRVLMIDPKRVELAQYEGAPHLVTQIANTPLHASRTLQWAIAEMNERYALMARNRCHKLQELREIPGAPRIPYVVIVVDEVSDFMTDKSARVGFEPLLVTLGQKARAAGIHLVLATQTPRREVITGALKANLPTRIALRVSSALDSRIILDHNGAEQLLGNGDSLLSLGGGAPERIHGAYVGSDDIDHLMDRLRAYGQVEFVTAGDYL